MLGNGGGILEKKREQKNERTRICKRMPQYNVRRRGQRGEGIED